MKKQQRNIFKTAKKDPRAPEYPEKQGKKEEDSTPKSAEKRTVRTEKKEEATPQKESFKKSAKGVGSTREDKSQQVDRPVKVIKTKAASRPKSTKPASKTKTGKIERKMEESIRLNRFISNAGVCSRRKADELIVQGKIKVNGDVITELGTKVSMRDKIEYDGRRLDIKDMVYILLNKPKNTITTMRDPKKRKTVMDLIDNNYQGIFPVGRLDRNTTGVLLITNDGELAHRLTHPTRKVKKVYRVKLTESVTKEHLIKLVEGIELEDGISLADKAVFVEDDQSVVGIEVHSGKNRIVRRMFEHLGYQVKQLERVLFAGLDKRKLRPGDWRELTPKELKHLRIQAGMNGGK